MKLSVVFRSQLPASASPYRLLDEHAQEIAWANTFLDAQCIRQLSPRSLRIYAYALLHFPRWSLAEPSHPLADLTQTTLLDYVRHQLDQLPPPAPQTVNHRLVVVHCLYRFLYGREIPSGPSHLLRVYTQRSSLGYGQPRRARALRLKQPHRLIRPLSAEEVARFWRSFRTFRDLAIVGLMLLDGLRSCEVLALQLADLHLPDAHLYVLGKGHRQRLLPLPQDILTALHRYLHREPSVEVRDFCCA